MNRLTQAAPAKVNLALDILGRRPDGYHEMYMVMQTVSLGDTVTLEEGDRGFTLTALGFDLPAGAKPLEQRAVEAFFQALGRAMPPLAVTLEKRTPAYAGLGGGSADAAALLRLLRQRYAPDMPRSSLETIGGAIGSDIPFCIRGGTALASGRGNELRDLPPLPDCRFIVCKPDFDLPTPQMFARLRFGEARLCPDVDGMVQALEQGSLENLAACVKNVFEEALDAGERREINAVKETLLRHGALAAAMSGSGPAVFGLFAPETETAPVLEELRKHYIQVFTAKPVGRLV